MAVIFPTVGRIVLYHPANTDLSLAAIITKVIDDSTINLTVFRGDGIPFSAVNTLLLQEDHTKPFSQDWATWMPYQKGQAAKTEEIEKKLSEVGASWPLRTELLGPQE